MMHIRWAPLTGHFREKGWQKHCKTMISPFFWTFLSGKQKDIFSFFRGLFYGCFILVGPGILGLALGVFTPGQLIH